MWRKQRSTESKGGGERRRGTCDLAMQDPTHGIRRRAESQGQRLAPSDEDELVGRRARLGVDLDVEHGVAAVSVGELSAEGLEILGLLALRLNLDELLVIGDLEDQVLQWGVWDCMGAYGVRESPRDAQPSGRPIAAALGAISSLTLYSLRIFILSNSSRHSGLH